jgi:Cadherin-like
MTFGANSKLFDPSDDPFFTVVGDRIEASYLPANSTPAGTAAGTGPGSVVAVTTGGITINLLFDAAAMAAPQSFRDGIQQAANLLAATISDHITVNLKIDYSGTGGGAAAGPDNGLYENYSTIRTDLINNATPGDTVFNALPAGSSIQSQSSVAVWNAELKLLGFLGANDTTTDDGSATFATDINPGLLVGVALHELTHALGRVPYGPQPDIFDLFRFTSAGVRLFQGGATAPAAYFSVDGGLTKLADLGRTSDASDFLNSGVQGPNDPFNEFYTGSTIQQLTAADLKQLDALGFHISSGSDTQAPSLVSDSPLSISTGATQTLTASLLGFSDNVSSAAQLHYTITVAPTNGTLLLNGSATSSFTQADINNGLVSYHETGSGVTSDSFHFTVTDAAGNATATDTFLINIDTPPTVSLPSGGSVAATTSGQALQFSSLFSGSDPDGDTLTYYLYDATPAATSGHFDVNGTAVPAQTIYQVTAAQLAQTTFVAGANGASDDLYVEVFDGHTYSGWNAHVNVSVAAAQSAAPTVSLPSGAQVAASTAGQALQLSSLFIGSDPDGDTLTYYLYDATPAANSGHFVVNGTAVSAETIYQVTAAQLAQTTFVAGANGTSDDLYVEVFDGHTYSGWNAHVNVSVAQNTGPQVSLPSGSIVGTTAGHSLLASSLFSGSDNDGDTLTYYLYDNSPAANSGHFMVGGTTVAAQTITGVSAAQFAQVTFVAGAAGTSDDLYVEVFDGQTYSGWNAHVNVSVASGQSPAPTVAPYGLAGGHFDFSSFNIGSGGRSEPQGPPLTMSDNKLLITLLADAQAAYAGQPHEAFQPAGGSHDTLGNHDDMFAGRAAFADLHAGFIH